MSDDPKPTLIGIDPAAGTDSTAIMAVLQRINGVELVHLNANAKVTTATEIELMATARRVQLVDMMRLAAKAWEPILERQLEQSQRWLERFEKERHERRRRERMLANKPPERRSANTRKRKRLTVLRMVARPPKPRFVRFRRYNSVPYPLTASPDAADAMAYAVSARP